jgi:hypothetical protein
MWVYHERSAHLIIRSPRGDEFGGYNQLDEFLGVDLTK